MVYVKQGIEIFFDNSNAIEIYTSGNTRFRLDNFYTQTVKDLIRLLIGIEKG